VLCSIHNVRFYQRLVRDARAAILAGDYAGFAHEFLARYQQETDAPETLTLPE
jgi:tRNA-guanine family transglycosylase